MSKHENSQIATGDKRTAQRKSAERVEGKESGADCRKKLISMGKESVIFETSRRNRSICSSNQNNTINKTVTEGEKTEAGETSPRRKATSASSTFLLLNEFFSIWHFCFVVHSTTHVA